MARTGLGKCCAFHRRARLSCARPPSRRSRRRPQDYDELHFSLGLPRTNASAANVTNFVPPPPPPPIPLTLAWFLYVRDPATANASWAFDAAVRPPVAGAPESVRVDVAGTAAANDGIDLSQVVANFEDGAYLLSFWAKASVDATPCTLNSRKNGGDWHNFGLDTAITLSAAWAQYNITFTSSSDGSQGRLSWFLGAAAPNASIWVNSPTLVGATVPPPVFLREFDCGAVILNGDTVPRAVALPGGAPFSRLTGQQAPLWQYHVDDASAAFRTTAGNWTVENFDSGYHADTTPSQEEVRPANGFYHHWASGAHRAPAPAAGGDVAAIFDLGVPAAGVYNVSVWWPAAVPARAGWARAMRATVLPGGAPLTVDLSAQGGDAFFVVAANVALDPSSALELRCPAGGGDCIADAVLVESVARFNDGSAAQTVALGALDAIVLKRTAGAPPQCA